MAFRLVTCPESGHLERIEYDDTPCGMLVLGCSSRASCCARTCAARFDRRERVLDILHVGDTTCLLHTQQLRDRTRTWLARWLLVVDTEVLVSRTYHRDGHLEWGTTAKSKPPTDDLPIPTIAGIVPVTDIMTRDVICARRDLPISQVITLVLDNYIGCLPVVDEQGLPIGMITKRDIVERLALTLSDRPCPDEWEAPTCAEDVMLPLAISLDEHASVLQAAQIMSVEYLHHIPVVSKGRIAGVVSSLDIARWLTKNDGMPS